MIKLRTSQRKYRREHCSRTRNLSRGERCCNDHVICVECPLKIRSHTVLLLPLLWTCPPTASHIKPLLPAKTKWKSRRGCRTAAGLIIITRITLIMYLRNKDIYLSEAKNFSVKHRERPHHTPLDEVPDLIFVFEKLSLLPFKEG